MEKKSVSLQIDDELLAQFDDFAKSVGSTRAGLISLFMKHCVIYRELPFKPGDRRSVDSLIDDGFDYRYNGELVNLIRDVLVKYKEK